MYETNAFPKFYFAMMQAEIHE